ncbi:MAG: TIGR03617 family F420-dependent LLM class oxidoreductase [Chloroflexi bacterium]|nr:TIGR03617 family F420-dependent LLM class oxidoreductase [Chloroflexota bacterium]
MKVYAGLRGATLAEVPEEAHRVEGLGFDGATLSELKHDPFMACALAIEHTSRLKVGTSIALAFPRSPMTTAYAAWDLQHFSQGRFELGLGTQVKGHIERRFSVRWTPPGPRMKEYVLALRAIWATWQQGAPLNFRGKDYSLTLMTPEFNPGPINHPRVPIFTAAVNPWMCGMGGEVSDGVLLHGYMTWQYIAEVALPAIEAGAKKAGRTLKDLEIAGGGFVVTAPSQQELERQLEVTRRRIAFYASTRTYLPVMGLHGWEQAALDLHRLSVEGHWEKMPGLVTDQMLDAFCVIGTYDDIVSRLRARYGGWATRISFPLPLDSTSDDSRIQGIVNEIHQIA